MEAAAALDSATFFCYLGRKRAKEGAETAELVKNFIDLHVPRFFDKKYIYLQLYGTTSICTTVATAVLYRSVVL